MIFPADEQDEYGLMTPPPSRKVKTFSLKLTSLIDMFTMILVFLLKSFSAEGEIMTVTDDLRLPESSSTKKPVVASIVAINQEYILLDGEQVIETSAILNMAPEASIPELSQALDTRKTLADGLGVVNEDMAFSGKINIQADKDIPYLIIKKVMMTCGLNGYNDIMLAVIEME